MLNFDSLVRSTIIEKVDPMLDKYHELHGYKVEQKVSGKVGHVISKERYLELSGFARAEDCSDVLIEFEDGTYSMEIPSRFVDGYKFIDDSISSNVFMMSRPNDAALEATLKRLQAAGAIAAEE